MKSLSLGARMLAASVVLAALVAGIFAILILAVVALEDARDREAHSKDVTSATVIVEKLVIDLETGLRGFVLTNNRRFRDPFQRAREELPQRLAELETLVADSPEQRRRARSLRIAIDRYINDFALQLIRIARDNPRAARSDDSTAAGKQQTDAIRVRFDELLAAENARAEESAASARTQSRRAIALGVTGLIGCALLSSSSGSTSRAPRHGPSAKWR